MEGKTVAQTRITMARSMQPPDANGYGNVHGGVIMRFVDEAAGAVAIRHSHMRCVTASLDHMSFDNPAFIGDLVTAVAFMTYVGRSSMEIECQVTAESMVTGEARPISTCFLVYVATDENGKPTPVPPLILETDEERQLWLEAEKRRKLRTHSTR